MQEGTIGKVAVCSNNARRRTLVSTIFLLLMQRKRTNYTFFFDSTPEIFQHCVILIHCIVVGSRGLMPPDALKPKANCTNPGL